MKCSGRNRIQGDRAAPTSTRRRHEEGPVADIDIKAKGEAVLQPGGLHVMMIDLKAPMKEGDVVPITLTFDDGSSKAVDAKVVRPVAAGMPMEHKH